MAVPLTLPAGMESIERAADSPADWGSQAIASGRVEALGRKGSKLTQRELVASKWDTWTQLWPAVTVQKCGL